MDHSRDNPLRRFTSFWWGIGAFLIFALVLTVVWLFVPKQPDGMEDVEAKGRYEKKAVNDAAQATSLSNEAIDAAALVVSKQLVVSKPVAMEVPTQIVPGSATSLKLAAAPAVDMKSIEAAAPAADLPLDPAVMAAGKASYMLCGACHGQNGEGGPIAPPLAGSEWVTGPVSNLVLIQLRGLQGPITVAGKEYNMPGGMAALAFQTDEQVASVLTYIRNSFGNKASAVAPAQVTALRGEVGKPAVTAAELIQP